MALVLGTPGVGRDERYWADCVEQLPQWDGAVTAREVLLLAPHPDDEVLGCGGLLQRWSRAACALEMWMVTDGEACFGVHAEMPAIAQRRRAEAYEAQQRLGIVATTHSQWLGVPDGAVAQHVDELYTRLQQRVTADTLLVAPLAQDGHPDHDAIGAVARAIAVEKKLPIIFYPIWLWHWGRVNAFATAAAGACRVELSVAEQCRKREAIAAFDSQIVSQTIRDHTVTPILPRRVLRHFRRSFEVVFREDLRASPNQPTLF